MGMYLDQTILYGFRLSVLSRHQYDDAAFWVTVIVGRLRLGLKE